MNKVEWNDYIKQHQVIFLDGATGSNLQRRGMPKQVCAEEWIAANPDVLKELQREYVESGSNIVYAPTFSANSIKLKEYGLEDRVVELNKRLVAISKEAVEGRALVAGDMTMTGQQLKPLGPLGFEELIEVYKVQIKALEQGGADLLVIETMMSLQETRAALIAVKEVTNLPILATMSFGEDGRTLYGTDAVTAAVVLDSLGASAVGINCSAGPDKMLSLVEQMRKVTKLPIIAKPNAGMPKLGKYGETEYDMGPDVFAEHIVSLVEAGATIVGGCCGTSPEYIVQTKEAVSKLQKEVATEKLPYEEQERIASQRKTVSLTSHTVIGEINSRKDAQLAEDLSNQEYDSIYDLIDDGEDEIEVWNVYLDGNRENSEEILESVLTEITQYTTTPLMFESESRELLDRALRLYPGRACLNTASADRQMLLQLASRYGALLY